MVKFGSPSLMAFIVKDKKLLVLKYSDFYNHPEVNQKYIFPGGRPNEKETLINTLVREVKEETDLGIQILNPIYIDLFINKPNGKIRPIMFCDCKITEDKEIKLSEEHEDYKWISLKEAKSLDWVDECFIRFLDHVGEF